MIKLLKKYGVELKLKKCDLFRLIEGQKDTFLEDGFAFKMTNEEEMFKYEVILNGIYNKTKIEGEYKRFVYETQDAIQYLNYEEKQKIIESANDMAREMSEGTKEYADNILAEVEDTMATLMGNMEAAQATVNSALATIKNNRNELK